MSKVAAWMLGVWLLLSPFSVFAQQSAVDPLQRNLIFAEGEAEDNIPINGVNLTFDFDVEKASFKEASQVSDEIKNKIEASLKEAGLNISISQGWNLIRQAKISLSSKGRKVANTLSVSFTDFPEGQLYSSIAKIIDGAIAADSSVVLSKIDVFLTKDFENKCKQNIVNHALKALDSNALQAAESLGKKIIGPKRVFMTAIINEDQNNPSDQRGWYSENSEAKNSFLSLQKSFRVNTEVVDSVKMNIKVKGVYQFE